MQLRSEIPGHALPSMGFVRLHDIIGRPEKPATKGRKRRPAVQGIYPVSRSTWWAGVRSGRYPQPVKLGARCVAWRLEDILTLIEAAASHEEAA